MGALLQGSAGKKAEPAIYAAAFRQDRERQNFVHLTHILDNSSSAASVTRSDRAAPEGEQGFFSGNIAGLSRVLSGVASESVVVRQSKGPKGKDEDESEDKVMQTVIYRWSP
jgi:hypothetical protein